MTIARPRQRALVATQGQNRMGILFLGHRCAWMKKALAARDTSDRVTTVARYHLVSAFRQSDTSVRACRAGATMSAWPTELWTSSPGFRFIVPEISRAVARCSFALKLCASLEQPQGDVLVTDG